MRSVDLENIDRESIEGVAPSAPEDPLGPARRRLPSPLAATAVVAALVAQVLVVAVVVVGIAEDTPSDAVTAGVVAQLPMLLVVVSWGYFRPRTLSPLESLGARVAEAEAALALEHDRVHELRATLAGVLTACRVLQDPQTRLSPTRRSRLQQLHDQEMERLERLLTDRRELAGDVDLDAAIDPLVESLRIRGIEVTWKGTGCAVHARSDDVIEAVHILLENAAQHASGRPVEVEVSPREHEVDIRVADRGPGIPPDLLPRLFDRWSHGTGSAGQGLGLNIAQRLAQEMGGLLRLAPSRAAGPGTTFVLTLPAPSEPGSCRAASG